MNHVASGPTAAELVTKPSAKTEEPKAAAELHQQRIDEIVAAGTGGVRRRLVLLLSKSTISRLTWDVGCGVAAAAVGLVALAAALRGRNDLGAAIFWFPLAAVALGWLAAFGVAILLALVVTVSGYLLLLPGPMSPRARVAWLAGVVGAASLLTLLPGPAAVRHAFAVAAVAMMPAGTVAGVGGWTCVRVHLRWRAAGNRLVRHAADALAATVAPVTILLLIDPTLLGAQAAAGLLFPVAVWLSIRGWRAMNASDAVAVRACADIAVSLMLGASVVGLLVLLANLFHMPHEEVVVLRETLDKTGKLLDVRWSIWASIFAALAAASVAFATWPDRLRKPIGWITRLRVVPSAEILRRGSAGAHIGLLLVMLVGAAGPAAIGPVLNSRIAGQYTQTLTDIARARGETAVLRQIARELPAFSPSQLAPLGDLILQIHKASKQPDDGSRGASSVELDLAARLGTLQAQTLAATASPPPLQETEARVTRDTGMDTLAGGASEESRRLGELDSAEQEDETAKEQAEQAGELAATVIAKTLVFPGIGEAEVVGIMKEYLSSLIEFSPLKDVFAAWTERLANRVNPPAVADLVVPDPAKLNNAAAQQMNQEVAKNPVSDNHAVKTLLGEAGVVGAVDLVNQTRFLQEDGTGPCDGCTGPKPADEHGGGGGGDEHGGGGEPAAPDVAP